MAVKESTVFSTQGYSIVHIQDITRAGVLLLETYGLRHESGGQIGEFASLEEAVNELNRMLFPLPGVRLSSLGQAKAC